MDAAFIVLQNRNKQKGTGDMNIQKAASDGRAGFNPFSFITAKCTCEA